MLVGLDDVAGRVELMMSWLGRTVVTSQGRAIVVTKMRVACGAAMVTFSTLQHSTTGQFYTSQHNLSYQIWLHIVPWDERL